MDLVIVSDARTPELKKITENCIDSFKKTCYGTIVVVEKQDVSYEFCTVIKQPERFNYNLCLNDGYLHTNSDWICFANNDVEFMEGWNDMVQYDFDSMSPLNPGWQFHKQFDGKSDPVVGYGIGTTLTGWCIVAKRSTIETIGGFDTDVEFWCSDNIYAEQLIYHGLKHALIPTSHVKHIASRTLFGSSNIKELTQDQAIRFGQAKKKYEKI